MNNIQAGSSLKKNSQFLADLKKINEELRKYICESLDKSAYLDFTPTFNDYIEQVKNLEKSVKENNQTVAPITTTSNNAPTFIFGKPSLFPTLSTPATTTTTSSTTPALSLSTTTSNSNPSTGVTFSFTGALFSAPEPKQPAVSNSNSFTTIGATPLKPFGAPTSISSTPSFLTNPPFGTSAPSFGTSIVTTATSNEVDNNLVESEQGDANDGEDEPPPEPNVDKFEETGYKLCVRSKLYQRTKQPNNDASKFELVGVGNLYVKSLEEGSKLQVIFRQEPDLRKVLMNEIVTPGLPIKMLPKAVQMGFSDGSGTSKIYIAKLAVENETTELSDYLTFKKV